MFPPGNLVVFIKSLKAEGEEIKKPKKIKIKPSRYGDCPYLKLNIGASLHGANEIVIIKIRLVP